MLELFQGWGWEIDVENKAVDANTKGFLCASQQKDNKIVVGPCFSPPVFAGPYWVKYYNETKGVALILGGQPNKVIADDKCGYENNLQNGMWLFSRERNPEVTNTTMWSFVQTIQSKMETEWKLDTS